jgi:hypothetical protein
MQLHSSESAVLRRNVARPPLEKARPQLDGSMSAGNFDDLADSADGRRFTRGVSRLGAWCIVFAPVIYFCVFMAEGWLRAGYDATSMVISQLSLGPRGWIQTVNFLVLGFAILLFSISVALEFGAARMARIGATLLLIIGISMVASAIFAIDPVGSVVLEPTRLVPRQMSFHSKFHYVVGTMAFLLAPFTCFCFLFGNGVSKDPAWKAFWRWSVALGIAMFAGVVLFKLTTLPSASNPLRPWQGSIQRAMVTPFLVWLSLFGWVILKRTQADRGP